MKKKILLAGILSLTTASVWAEGFYITGDIGQSKVEFDAGNDFNVSKTDTSYSIGAGFDINNFAAVEVSYRDLGSIEGGYTDEFDDTYSSRLDVSALQASVIGKLPVSDTVHVFGRLGFANIEVDSKYNYAGFKESDSESETKALFGLGASFDVTPEFAIRAEYNQYAKWDDTKLSALTVGATYHF